MFVSATLQLETGATFSGMMPAWAPKAWQGEVVFTTGMTGYVESLTDPSFSHQILTFTFPLIGNYGVSPKSTWESERIHAKGMIVSSLTSHASHHLAEKSLADWLYEQQVPYLCGVDTRELTKTLRMSGTVRGCVFAEAPSPWETLSVEKLKSSVKLQEPRVYGEGPRTIILVDCGMKENILRCLLKFPLCIKRVPYDYDYSQEEFDGVVLSNGPGDPLIWHETIAVLQKAMQCKKPIFGVCLGAQMLALSTGAKTFKLPFGHRGHNQPCIESKTGKAFLTSQNHGYAIDPTSLQAGWEVSFRNLNDGSVEGICHDTLPFSAVQFHPEAAPGPVDTLYLFENFYKSL